MLAFSLITAFFYKPFARPHPSMSVQASNVTVGASALATPTSLQLTASLINSVGSDKLCCLGQAFAAIVDAEIADGSVGVRV